MDSRYHSLLSDLGYLPINDINKKISISILDAFQELGEPISKALTHHLPQRVGLAFEQLLTDYDALEHALRKLLGKGADILIEMIKFKLAECSVSRNHSLPARQIINEIRESEALDFISKRKGHERLLLLYKDERSKEKMIKRFFDPAAAGNAPKGIMMSSGQGEKDHDFLSSVPHRHYSSFFNHGEREKSAEKISDWISGLHSQNRNERGLPSRIAGEEDTWCFENGFADEILTMEENIGCSIKENMLVLCTYNLAKIEHKPEYVRKIIKSHNFVVFDEPFSLYGLGGEPSK